jgi:hypothetical protein
MFTLGGDPLMASLTASGASDASKELPDRLPGLKGFKVDKLLNDGKEGGVVALLVRYV